jgi:hypothetical protein
MLCCYVVHCCVDHVVVGFGANQVGREREREKSCAGLEYGIVEDVKISVCR